MIRRLHALLCRWGIHYPGQYIDVGSIAELNRFVIVCKYCGTEETH
jgi:hypothetical protein